MALALLGLPILAIDGKGGAMTGKRRPTGIKIQVGYSDEVDDAICLTVVVEGSGLPKMQYRVPLRDAEEISENLWGRCNRQEEGKVND